MSINTIKRTLKESKLLYLSFSLWKKGCYSDFGVLVFGLITTYILRAINHADTIESIENSMNGILIVFLLIDLSYICLLVIIKYYSHINWIYKLLRHILLLTGNYLKLQRGPLFFILGVAVANEYFPQAKYVAGSFLWLVISFFLYLFISVKEAIRLKLRAQRNNSVK